MPSPKGRPKKALGKNAGDKRSRELLEKLKASRGLK